MNDNLRACIAFLVGRISGASRKSSVFDHAQGKHINISGSIGTDNINVFDHDRGAHISGSLPNLYDHDIGAHISVNFYENQVRGFDHGSGSHYSGNVGGSTVTIFDHGTGQHYHYSI
jgi:hypothetical protein